MKHICSIIATYMLLGVTLSSATVRDPLQDAPILPSATQIEQNRYSSPKNYQDTVHWYQRYIYKRGGGVRWHTIVHLPSIKAKHVRNLRHRRNWRGINIYEHNGKVRIYILPQEPKPAGKAS